MTSDLLSLEQIFGATQRRLRQLSDGPAGPVANKATKVQETEESPKCLIRCLICRILSCQMLRQFEALIGGRSHSRRHNAASSGHQETSNLSDPFLSAHAGHSTTLNHDQTTGLQPQLSLADVLSGPSHLDSGSSAELNDDKEKQQQQQQQHALSPGRTADLDCPSPPCAAHRVQPCVSTLSLFSGMELVTKGKPPCVRPTSQSSKVNNCVNEGQRNLVSHSPADEGTSSICSSVVSDSSQPVSAFSFLNS